MLFFFFFFFTFLMFSGFIVKDKTAMRLYLWLFMAILKRNQTMKVGSVKCLTQVKTLDTIGNFKQRQLNPVWPSIEITTAFFCGGQCPCHMVELSSSFWILPVLINNVLCRKRYKELIEAGLLTFEFLWR